MPVMTVALEAEAGHLARHTETQSSTVLYLICSPGKHQHNEAPAPSIPALRKQRKGQAITVIFQDLPGYPVRPCFKPTNQTKRTTTTITLF